MAVVTASIISVSYLDRELPSDADDTNGLETNAILQATDFINESATRYDTFPVYTDNGDDTYTINAPRQIERICIELSKAFYWMSQGQVYRDGEESIEWERVVAFYGDRLKAMNLEPSIYSKTISLDSNGVMLIEQYTKILRWHPMCRVVSDSTNIWNQGKHWDIRKGTDSDDEYLDGWYFDAETYSDSIEGTLYYARTWRNDGLDYQRFLSPKRASMLGQEELEEVP